ncbi:GIY-YIG nuclease family protein [Ferrovibrio xuzhouensis]|uniref:GIY-YIG nuclease family protein n=1 Tax=Ferrovibrio xuzhouensis TaxID=1576914 RepID=A0ABV7VKI2_9PROT
MAGGWIYIVTDKPYGTLYTGVTSDIQRRAWEHREAVADGFTKRHGLKRLVYIEAHDTIQDAILREKRVKRWRRAWKIELIQSVNPTWADLYDTLA